MNTPFRKILIDSVKFFVGYKSYEYGCDLYIIKVDKQSQYERNVIIPFNETVKVITTYNDKTSKNTKIDTINLCDSDMIF